METASARLNAATSSAQDQRKTRPQVIRDFTRRALDETSLTVQQFTLDLIAEYTRATPRHAGRLPMWDIAGDVDADDFLRLLDARKAQVKAFMDPDGPRHFPCELEEAWVAALPDPYRTELRHALVRRHGCMGVDPVAGQSPEDDLRGIGRVLDRVAKVAERYAPLISDGVLDHRDARDAQAALDACDEAAAALIGLRQRIAERTQLRAVA